MQATIEFERRVAEHIATQGGLSVDLEWAGRGPDMVVRQGKDIIALVEAKTSEVRLPTVLQVNKYAHEFSVPAIICVPDGVFPIATESVQEWADINGVMLLAIRDLDDALTKLVGAEPSSVRTKPHIPAKLPLSRSDIFAAFSAAVAVATLTGIFLTELVVVVSWGRALVSIPLLVVAALGVIGYTTLVSYERPWGPVMVIAVMLVALMVAGLLFMT